MPSDKVIHHLETGVPLIVDEYPGGEDLPTSKSQSDNDPPFDSVVFMYGMFAGVVAPLSTFAFHLLIRGDAASMANILEHEMMHLIHAIVLGIIFNTTTYFLCVKLMIFGFDRNTRSSS